MTPQTNDEHIGIEIECLGTITRDDLRELFDNNTLLSNKVEVGYDASVNDYDNDLGRGHEVRILCTNTNRTQVVVAVMEILNEAECYVNETCSVHVHLDMRNKSTLRVRTIFFNLVKCSELLFNVSEGHRRDSDYCQANTYATMTGTLDSDRDGVARRRAINAHAYPKFTTLEVRLHHGSLDDVEVNSFIGLLLKIKNKKRRLQDNVESIDDMRRFITRDTRLLQQMEERIERYSNAG